MSIHRPKSKCLKVTKVYPKVIAHISFIFHICRPDALHWLGITKIHKFISMSDMKYDAIINSGIKIVERIPIPPELIPKDAQVEIAAKVIVTVNLMYHKHVNLPYFSLLKSTPSTHLSLHIILSFQVFVGYHGGDQYKIGTEDDLKFVKGRATDEY